MAEYIEREAAIAVIEEKQKELCPLGRYSRTMVYGSDRDKFDSWQEIIDRLEAIPAADVVEVRHGKWAFAGYTAYHGTSCQSCSLCKKVYLMEDTVFNYCPNCGAKIDGGVNDGKAD